MYLIGLLFLLASCAFNQSIPPQEPVIGIFTQTYEYAQGKSYIAASYVKFIEMSGAQVVPIFSFSETSEIKEILEKVNGVLFPGGAMEFSIENQWTKNADYILKYAKEENDQGRPFPLWFTCLGHELVSYLTSNYNANILSKVNGDEAIILPIQLTGKQSYIFETFSKSQIQKMTSGQGLMYYNHVFAVRSDTFKTNPYLKEFWDLIATSTTPYSQEFVAVMEAKKYPFYSVQFHPEKNLYEWKVYADRSTEGAEVVQIMSNRFIEIARKNEHKFQSPELFTKASIYNYKTTFTNPSSFTQVYLFDEKPREDQLQKETVII